METAANITDPRYPIGNFQKSDYYPEEEFNRLISIIESAPGKYKCLAQNLSAEDLKKTYREGSWNVGQLFHHVADIQLVHFFRMKKALTEPDYKEVTLINMDEWVKTADGINAPINDSLIMLEGITKRYVFLLKSLTEKDLKIEYYHPLRKFNINQAQAAAMSAWHLQHHLEHIKIALQKNN